MFSFNMLNQVMLPEAGIVLVTDWTLTLSNVMTYTTGPRHARARHYVHKAIRGVLEATST